MAAASGAATDGGSQIQVGELVQNLHGQALKRRRREVNCIVQSEQGQRMPAQLLGQLPDFAQLGDLDAARLMNQTQGLGEVGSDGALHGFPVRTDEQKYPLELQPKEVIQSCFCSNPETSAESARTDAQGLENMACADVRCQLA